MRSASVLLLLAVTLSCGSALKWWQSGVIYQIYPRSFKDTDGDGVGDLKGITQNLEYLVDLGVSAVWLSPIFKSPMVDFGYDISNYTEIDPLFGTMADFDELRDRTHQLGLKLILDFVVSYTSDQMDWYQKSLRLEDGYDDWYLWARGAANASAPHGYNLPSNWLSAFRGSGWAWSDERQQFYFHSFTKQQPDLNYRTPAVVSTMQDVLRFWLDKGVDGFRVDAVPQAVEDINLHDESPSGLSDDPEDYEYLTHVYTQHQPETYALVQGWRKVIDEYESKDGSARVMMTETYGPVDKVMAYYGTVENPGAHFPFNFYFITELNHNSTARDLDRVVHKWLDNLPQGAWPDWVLGNHDQRRVASRFTPALADGIHMISLLLPGTAITYMGEEIGMEDTFVSWEQSVDPWALNAGPDKYLKYTRDPERTPFQWDDSVSAGFSTSENTWLPVNSNYKTLNVATEKSLSKSHYHVYKSLVKLRSSDVVQKGSVDTRALSDNVFAFTRFLEANLPLIVVVNLSGNEEVVDLTVFNEVATSLKVHTASINSSHNQGDTVESKVLSLGPWEALLLTE